jgi:hypothetical protein
MMSAHRVGGDELTIGLIERVDGLAHGEQPGHVRIADDQHVPSTCSGTTPAYARRFQVYSRSIQPQTGEVIGAFALCGQDSRGSAAGAIVQLL